MIVTNAIESKIDAPFLSAVQARMLGLRINEPVKLFMKKAIKPYGKIDNGNITILSNSSKELQAFLESEKDRPSNTTRYFNAYKELLTTDLQYVTPVVTGKFKDVVTQFSSIQREGVSEDSQIIIQFSDGVVFTISKFNLTDIYIGSMPNFVRSHFTTVYKGFTFESLVFLLDRGMSLGLKNFVSTIGTLNLSFSQEQVLWMKTTSE